MTALTTAEGPLILDTTGQAHTSIQECQEPQEIEVPGMVGAMGTEAMLWKGVHKKPGETY